MYKGVVKFFQAEKNYGFITPDEGGTDFFFHGSKTITPVQANDHVEFVVVEGRKGPEAQEIKVIEDEAIEDDDVE